MSKQCYSDIECKIIKAQVERRAKYRKEFLKERTDPCKHAKESGYVFDSAIQRFMTLKCYQIYYFKPSMTTVLSGIVGIAPFFLYGFLLWSDRQKFLKECACGTLKYRDRRFKLV